MIARPLNLNGSALIGVVVAILIFSVLAAAIVPMISSSAQQTAAANIAEKAYLMAESGFRYAAAKYIHAGTFQYQKNAALDDLDGNYTLSDGQSRFDLQVYAYFFEIIGNAPIVEPRTYKAHCPGSFPPDMIITPGGGTSPKLSINNQPYTVTNLELIPGEDDNITITVDQPILFDPDPDLNMAYPAADAPSVETVTQNGNTVYNYIYAQDDADMFPLRNGRILSGNTLLTYRFNDHNANKLIDVRDPQNPAAVIQSLPIVLSPQVRVDAIGIYGTGNQQTRRQVTYYTPLPLALEDTQREVFTDRFDSKQDWVDTQGTVTDVGNVAGNSALVVQSASTAGSNVAALTIFSPTTPAALRLDFNSARHGTRGYLSYDAQLKVGFDAAAIPDYFAAGLSFRLSNTEAGFFGSNGYGISFLRGSNSAVDGIADELVPDAVRDQKAIVLWQQTTGGTRRRWLAYKKMQDLFFSDDTEEISTDRFHQVSGTHWHLNTLGRQNGNSTRNWYYGDVLAMNYDQGDNNATIESDEFSLPNIASIMLSFWSWHETESETDRPDYYLHDLKQVYVCVSGSCTLEDTIDRGPSPGIWYRETVDLSAYAGQAIRIRFVFDTVDDQFNHYEGWYVDDVEVYYDWPLQNSALDIRLQEAMVVRFSDGSPKIRAGSRLLGHTRNTTATVMAPPLVTAGDWSEGNKASGILLLKRPSVLSAPAFVDGEVLTVIGAGGRAVVAAAGYNGANDRKTNILQAFYASQVLGGSGGNTDPSDLNTNPYPRLGPADEPVWPPEVDDDGNWTLDGGNWTASEDYFRLIEWDGINDGNVTDLTAISFTTKDQGLIQNAVIQNHDPDLQSPSFPGLLSEAEIGLHALGNGAEDTYFDDFSIRIDVTKSDSVPAPLQQ